MNSESKNKMSGNVLLDSNLYLIFLVTLFAVMGVASIAPAFPQVIKYFSITKQEIGWLIAAFTLPGIFISPFLGIMADRVGRKNILIPSLMLFGIAGFCCAFVHSFNALLIFRFIQGIGAAAIGSLNVTLIGDLYEAKKRKEAMGYNASVLSLGTASYPAIGGALALAGWNYPFMLPILAVPIGLFIAVRLNNPEPEKLQGLRLYLKNTWKIICQRKVIGLFIINILVFFLLYGASLTYLPILLEERVHANSLHIGLIMTLMSLVTAITSSQLTRINRFLADQLILPVAILFYALSMFLIIFSQSWILIIIPVMLFGLGHGLFIPTVQTLLAGMAPLNERAFFMSLNTSILRIGQTIGPLVLGVSFAFGGLKAVFITGVGIAFIMLLTALIVLRVTYK
jgi:MFS transporter, ACDE family, multidrug resistance protein